MTSVHESKSSTKKVASSSRSKAFSVKTGVTMATQNSVQVEANVFRDQFVRLSSEVDNLTWKRNDLEKEIRQMQVKYENMRKENLDLEWTLKAKELVLKECQAKVNISENVLAEQSRFNKLQETKSEKEALVQQLSEELNSVCAELEKTMAADTALIDNTTALREILDGLIKSIQKRTTIMMKSDDLRQQFAPQYSSIVEQENELLRERDKLREQLKLSDTKRFQLMKALATEIESLDEEENSVQTLEQSVDSAQARLQETQWDNDDEYVQTWNEKSSSLREENAVRRSVCEKMRKVLDRQRQFFEEQIAERKQQLEEERQRIQAMKQTTQLIATVNDKFEESKPSMTKEEAEEKLSRLKAEKQEHLEQLTSEINQLEDGNKGNRGRIEEKWQKKMKRIGKYSKRLTKKDAISLQISEIEEEIDELTELSKTMEQQIETAKKRRILSVKSQEEDRVSSNKSTQIQLEEKQKHLLDQRQTSQSRRRQINLLQQETDDLTLKVSKFENYVLSLEREANECQTPIQQALDDLGQNTQVLDSVIESVSPIKRR